MKNILYIPLYILLFSCSDDKRNLQPDRPNNVPASTFWQGGINGGAWYKCKNKNKQYYYYCTIYNDFTGDIWYEGDFELYVNNNKEKIPLRNYIEKKQFTIDDIKGFDGENMYLYSSLSLQPVEPIVH